MSFTLQAGARQIVLSAPLCMGIINTTPDSFSDGAKLAAPSGGRFRVDVDKVLQTAAAMVDEGASFVDIGGESTRPGAEPVSIQEELDRVIPAIEAIRQRLDVCISVDTSSPEVIAAATAAGAELVNDVRALTRDGALQAAAASGAAVCLMHMQGQPGTMQQTIHYADDVVAEVGDYLGARVGACRDAGIASNQLVVDPGFGFGKTVAHNFRLLKHLAAFKSLDLPLLVGISRKSMLGKVTGRDVEQRLPASVAAATLAMTGGAHIIRAHDVAATMDAIRVHCAFRDQ